MYWDLIYAFNKTGNFCVKWLFYVLQMKKHIHKCFVCVYVSCDIFGNKMFKR